MDRKAVGRTPRRARERVNCPKLLNTFPTKRLPVMDHAPQSGRQAIFQSQ
jgi:hypothetical protein